MDIKSRYKGLKTHFFNKWKQKWKNFQRTINLPTTAQRENLSLKRLKRHKGLEKLISSLAMQIRTGKIGFANFLFRCCVLGVISAACPYGYPRQTAKHVLLFSFLHADRSSLRAAGPLDFKFFTETHKGLKAAATWRMRKKLLAQFTVAEELLDWRRGRQHSRVPHARSIRLHIVDMLHSNFLYSYLFQFAKFFIDNA